MGRFGEISHQIRAQRLEVVNPLAGQQALDAVRAAQTLLEQALTPARQLPRPTRRFGGRPRLWGISTDVFIR